MKLSVILCTHNPRRDFLERCLKSLQNQSLDYEDWEILLIDNGSKDAISEKYDISWHPSGWHVHEEKLGLSHARARGISETKGEIIVFIDDDTVIANDYLEKALIISKEWPFIGAWGGHIIPEFEVPPPDWIGSGIWRLTVSDVKNDIWSNLREGFETKPAGAGMCVRRNVAECYLEHSKKQKTMSLLDRSGSDLMGYGDMDLVQCAMDLGLGTGKSTKLSLTHLIPASRLTLEYFVRHAEGDAVSLVLYLALRKLSLPNKSRSPLVDRIKLLIMLFLGKITPEHYLIMKAHYRGIKRGYERLAELSSA